MASTTRSQLTTTTSPPPHNTTTFFRHLHETTPQSSHLLGFLTLIVSGGILLILTGLTFTAIVLGFILFAPIIVISSPFWLPVAVLVFFPIAGFLALCGFGVATLVTFSWFYRYCRGLHPPGSDRFDYARNRIATTAREYGGYLHSKVKDAAPGA